MAETAGRTIVAIRKRHGETQVKFAKRLGVSWTRISRLERDAAVTTTGGGAAVDGVGEPARRDRGGPRVNVRSSGCDPAPPARSAGARPWIVIACERFIELVARTKLAVERDALLKEGRGVFRYRLRDARSDVAHVRREILMLERAYAST